MASLAERDLAAVIHPCGHRGDYRRFPPLEVVAAEGCRIRLADGREVIDGISSWWCKSLGHRHPRLTAALTAQAGVFEHVLGADLTSQALVAFSEELLAVANAAPSSDPAYAATFLSGDGATGIEVALKMAVLHQRLRGAGGRTRFAGLDSGYHGESVATMSVSDCALYRAPYESLCFPTAVLGGLPLRLGPEDPRWMDASAEWPGIVAQLERIEPTLAGIIIEPVLQGAGGMRLFSPDLLRRLRAWCTAHGVLLIHDEIASGMGRLGTWLAADHAEVRADIAVLSKGLTGGYLPLTATLVTAAIRDAFDGEWHEGRSFLHSTTYSGNALGVAVARAVLAVMADEDVLGQVARRGPLLRRGLEALGHPCLRGVRGCGMMAAVDVVQADGTPFPGERRIGHAIYRAALDRGALLRPLGDTMYLLPPLIADEAVIGDLLTALAGALDTVIPRR